MPDLIRPTPADMRRLDKLKRNDALLRELDGPGPKAQSVRAAARFAVATFEGHAFAFADPVGATAFADTLLAAMEGPGQLPGVRLDLFHHTDDPVLAELRVNALDILVVGAVALARTGHDLERLAPDLVRFAADPTPDAIELRRVLLGGLPFGPHTVLPRDFLLPIEEFLRHTCVVGVVGALRNVGGWAVRATTDADGITSLVPASVCARTKFSILGSGFGKRRPPGTDVMVPSIDGGWIFATVVSWSATEIVVQAPARIGPGCVGFVRGSTPQGPIPENVVGELEHCFGPTAGRWNKLDDPLMIGFGDGPPCLPGDANRLLAAGPPLIQSFIAANEFVEPGGSINVTWATQNATAVTITKIRPAGPPVPAGTLSLSGALTLGAFTGTTPVTATYELLASNACGSVRRSISVALRARANLSILGVEVVQSVQRSDNSVRLVAGQRTAVRVFVDSGIRNGFNSGAGANELAGIQVTVLARPIGGGPTFWCTGPWAPTVHAKPAVDRNAIGDSFTFDVPVTACSGSVRFEVTARIPVGIGSIAASAVNSAVEVDFHPKARQELLPILITDSVNPHSTPTLAQYLALLAGARARQPFTDTGFQVNPPLSWSTGILINLRTELGWAAMLTRLTTAMFLFPNTPVGGIRTGAVANDGAYTWGGLAVPRIALTVPSLICQINSAETFAHELGHTYGLMHVNCGSPAGPYDGRLPLLTDEPGIDVRGRSLIPSGSSELMTYCSPQWVSTAHWDAMFDRIPV
ncbi:MAG: hypothetical protein IMZ75_08140 [Actinobacteria bacterium]|nr:hypothetical protein [Actinomycetota bacterium]